MQVQEQIDRYISEQPRAKAEELQDLHQRVLRLSPKCRLWFLDGRNDEGKVVSNPNIGYGAQTSEYANGETREFYRIGLSANTTGISVYVMGLEDRTHLSQTYGAKLGKAKVTGYCIKFRSLKDIDVDVLEEIVASHLDPKAT
jgi:hypothetical protein